MAWKQSCDLCGKDITNTEIKPPPVSIGCGPPGSHWGSEGSCWVVITFSNPPEMCEACLRKAEKKAAKAILKKLEE